MKSILTILLITSLTAVFGGDTPKPVPDEKAFWPISSIPSELRKDADAVLRREVSSFSINPNGTATLQVSKVVTIFDESMEDEALLIITQDAKLRKSHYQFPVEVFDRMGTRIKTYGPKDEVERSSGGMNGQFVMSDEMKIVDARQKIYPYTVQYTYTTVFKGFFSFPKWVANMPGMAVEDAQFSVSSPTDFPFRFTGTNGLEQPVQTPVDGDTRYVWSIKQVPALKREAYGPDYEELLSILYLAPDKADIQDYSGEVNDWETTASFIYQFYQDKITPAQEMKAEAEAVIQGAGSKHEKVKRLYQYMQGRTRYVGIQLGIGGWDPFSPSYVHDKGYGDCKALSNYMRSLLSVAGIESFPVVIYAGKRPRPVRQDFPSANQFNHVILAVPIENDTCWLECTSQQSPCGYLGDFTENRHGLLLKIAGGGLVKTPSRDETRNRQIRHAHFDLLDDGNANVEITTTFTGYQHEDWRGASYAVSGRDLEKWVDKRTHLTGFYRDSLAITTDDDPLEPSATCILKGIVANKAKPSGSRIFLKLNDFEHWVKTPKAIDDRKQDVIWRQSFWDTDTIFYSVPEGYLIESAPDNIAKESSWGSYEATFMRMPDGRLRYTRSLRLFAKRQGPESYEEMRSFLKAVSKADRMQAVLVNKS
ncbi:MAG: transglutaminase family protein [Bacteroidia bacterium]